MTDQDTLPPFWSICLRKLFNLLGMLGMVLILYGAVSACSGQPWPWLDDLAGPLSITLTLVGVLLVASSIYYGPVRYTPPVRFSRFVSGPLTIMGACIAVYFTWFHALPLFVCNGFALLGIAGALFRLQPNPHPPS